MHPYGACIRGLLTCPLPRCGRCYDRYGHLARCEDCEEPFAQLDQRGVCDARHVALCLGLFALRARERRGQCAVSSKEQAGTLAREVSAEEEAREVEEEAPYESGGQGGGGGG